MFRKIMTTNPLIILSILFILSTVLFPQSLYVAEEAPHFIDMNVGESFRFQLKNGEERLVTVQAQRLLYPSTYDYAVQVDLNIDGHDLTMTRWFSSLKQLTAPKIVNGIRYPLDGFEEIEITVGSICDNCQNEVLPGDRVNYHVRLGTIFCMACQEK